MIQSLLIIILIWIVILLSQDVYTHDEEQDDDLVVTDYTQTENDQTYVVLTDAIEENSHIVSQPLQKTNYAKINYAYGLVIDPAELLNSKTELNSVANKKNALDQKINESEKQLEMLVELNQDNKNVSDLVVHEKEIEIKNLKYDRQSSQNQIEGLFNNINQNWGNEFVSLLKNPSSNKLRCLFQNACRLAKVTFDSFLNEDLNLKKIFVSSFNNSEEYSEALYISHSPVADPTIQGYSYFYLINNIKFALGAKIKASINQSDDDKNHLFIPNEAVIWSNGKAWVYTREIDQPKFIRRSLSDAHEIENGFIINEGYFKEGQLIVIDGSQLLLSEEFKYQIKNENED